MRKAMTELERRLTEAAEKLEAHYEGRKSEMEAFEGDLIRRLTVWAKGLDALSNSVEELHERQNASMGLAERLVNLEVRQEALAKAFSELATTFETFVTARRR